MTVTGLVRGQAHPTLQSKLITQYRLKHTDGTRKFCISSIHPAETFPFVIAVAIMVQGFVFEGLSGTGLENTLVDGCSSLGQVMWVGELPRVPHSLNSQLMLQ